MTDEEKLRALIKSEMEIFIRAHGWPDEYIQQALIEVAKDHLWKQGAYQKLRYWTNVIGFLGVIGAAGLFVASLFGYEVVARK